MCRVVCGDIDTCADAVDDRRVGGKPTPAPKSQTHTFDETRTVMNTLVGQRLWKYKLMAGVLTIVVGAILLAWPGPSILVAATLFGVYLLVSGLAELFIAVTVRLSTATRVMLFISGALSVVLAILSFRHFGDAYAVLLLSLAGLHRHRPDRASAPTPQARQNRTTHRRRNIKPAGCVSD